jgi:hypothetical protein
VIETNVSEQTLDSAKPAIRLVQEVDRRKSYGQRFFYSLQHPDAVWVPPSVLHDGYYGILH